MNSRAISRFDRPAGLTLIELLVVLTILIALGGIVVTSLPGLLGKTRTATAAANIPEIDAAIRRQLVTSGGELGNRFDSLIAGSASGEVAGYLDGNEYFEAVTLSESDVDALRKLGISELVPASSDPADATFESHLQSPVPVENGTRVCAVASAFSGEMMQRLWNIEPQENTRYLVFGLGSRSSLVGGSETALFPEAPLHFSGEAASSPDKMYCRYLIVVELRAESESRSRARYVGVAMPGDSGLRGISEELRDAWSGSQ